MKTRCREKENRRTRGLRKSNKTTHLIHKLSKPTSGSQVVINKDVKSPEVITFMLSGCNGSVGRVSHVKAESTPQSE